MTGRSNAERIYVVAYDISDPKRWRRVFRLMKGFGRWLQLSMFQCRLTGSRRIELSDRLSALIESGEDHVVILDLGPAHAVSLSMESLGRTVETIERRATVV